MAAPRLRAKNASGGDLGTISFANVPPGTPSSATALRILNDNSQVTVDTAENIRVSVREIDQSSGEAVLRGLRAVDERWIELRALGTGSSGSTQQATGWTPVGRGRYLELASLDGGEYHDLEIRYNPPGTAADGQIEFLLEADADSRLTSIEQGHTETSRDGVTSGIGDGRRTELWKGAAPTANGPIDDKINVPDLGWLHEGVPKVLLAASLTLNDQDASAQTLGVGEAYWAVLSLGSGGSITVTKSNKGTAPLSTSTIPATPTGEILYTVVERQQAGISDSDIDFRADVERFGLTASGLNLTIGPGRARVDNALIKIQVPTVLALNANKTNTIWLMPDGDGVFQVTEDGSRPEARALKLYQVDTDASSILLSTTLVDYRDLLGPERIVVPVQFEGALSDALDRHLVFPGARPAYIRVDRGVVFRIHDAGSGNTAGIYRVDISIGGTDIYTSKGTDDRRAKIEHDSSPQLDTSSLPEVLTVQPFDPIVVTLKETEAYNGTGPSDASIALIFEMP